MMVVGTKVCSGLRYDRLWSAWYNPGL